MPNYEEPYLQIEHDMSENSLKQLGFTKTLGYVGVGLCVISSVGEMIVGAADKIASNAIPLALSAVVIYGSNRRIRDHEQKLEEIQLLSEYEKELG